MTTPTPQPATPPTHQPLLQRLLGVVTFKPASYRDIASDPTALTPAAVIVGIMALITASVVTIFVPDYPLVAGVSAAVMYVLVWFGGGWLYALVAGMLGGRGDVGALLRVTGFSAIFVILMIIPFVGFIGSILNQAGTITGIREAAFPDRPDGLTKAIITAVLVFMALTVVVTLLVLLLTFVVVWLGIQQAAPTGT